MKRLLISVTVLLMGLSLLGCNTASRTPSRETEPPKPQWTTVTEATGTANGLDVLVWMPSGSIEASTTYARAVAKATNSTDQTRTAVLARIKLLNERGEVVYDSNNLIFILVGSSVPPGAIVSEPVGFPVKTPGRYRLQFTDVLSDVGEPVELRFLVVAGDGG